MDAIAQYLAKPWLKFYDPRTPAVLDVPLQSIPQAFDEAARRSPERMAVMFYGRGITYGELLEATDRLACALAELGVKKGDRVALYLLNSPQFIIAYFAALKCGATVTPISPVYTSHEVRFQLEDSGARVVICQDILHDKVAKSGATLDHVVVTNVGEYLPTLKRFLGKGPLAKLFSDVNLGSPEIPPAKNLHWLQDLLRKYPAEAAAGRHRPEDGPRRAAVHRRHDRPPEGGDAHAPQPRSRRASSDRPPSRRSSPARRWSSRSCPSSTSTGRWR